MTVTLPSNVRSPVLSGVERAVYSLHCSTDLREAVQLGATKTFVCTSLSIIRGLVEQVPAPADQIMQSAWAHIHGKVGSSIEVLQALGLAVDGTVDARTGEEHLAHLLALLARDLWAMLPELDVSHVTILSPLLRIAVRVSGQRQGFRRIATLLAAISAGTAQGPVDPFRHGSWKGSGAKRARTAGPAGASAVRRTVSLRDALNGTDLEEEEENIGLGDSDSDVDSDVDSEGEGGESDSGSSAAMCVTAEGQILQQIRERNVKLDQIRLKTTADDGSTALDDANADADATRKRVNSGPQGGSQALVGAKAESAVLAEVLKIVSEAAKSRDMSDSGGGGGGDKDGELKNANLGDFEDDREARWVGNCAFCLLQLPALSPVPTAVSPRSGAGSASSAEPLGEIGLLIDSPFVPLVKRAAAVEIASKWMQCATRDVARLLRELTLELQAAAEAEKHRDISDGERKEGEDEEEGEEEDGEEEQSDVEEEEPDEEEEDDEEEEEDEEDSEEDLDSEEEEEEEEGEGEGEDASGHRPHFAHLSYVLLHLGSEALLCIRSWLLQEAETAADRAEQAIVHKDDSLHSHGLKRGRGSQNSNSWGSASRGRGGAKVAAVTSGAVSVMARRSQLLLHRIDRFVWSLKQVLHEVDRPRKIANGKGRGKGQGKGTSSRPSSEGAELPAWLHRPLSGVHGAGRRLLDRLLQEEALYSDVGMAGNDGDRKGSPAPVLGNRKAAPQQLLHASFARQMGIAGRKRRMRSRNAVVDDWLEGEGGDDAYADLEDFLVEE